MIFESICFIQYSFDGYKIYIHNMETLQINKNNYYNNRKRGKPF